MGVDHRGLVDDDQLLRQRMLGVVTEAVFGGECAEQAVDGLGGFGQALQHVAPFVAGLAGDMVCVGIRVRFDGTGGFEQPGAHQRRHQL
ncbi:MAG: hypothetical protein ACFCVG_05340, partial [Kineosporiaceae bacterium]